DPRAKALALVKESRALWQALGDPAGEEFCAVFLAWLALDVFIAHTADELAAIEQSFHQGEAFAQATGDDWLLSWVLAGLARCRYLQDDRAGAQGYIELLLQSARRRGDVGDISESLGLLATVARADYAQRVAWLVESEQLARELGDAWQIASIHNVWGE